MKKKLIIWVLLMGFIGVLAWTAFQPPIKISVGGPNITEMRNESSTVIGNKTLPEINETVPAIKFNVTETIQESRCSTVCAGSYYDMGNQVAYSECSRQAYMQCTGKSDVSNSPNEKLSYKVELVGSCCCYICSPKTTDWYLCYERYTNMMPKIKCYENVCPPTGGLISGPYKSESECLSKGG